jgi:hypothetical protein
VDSKSLHMGLLCGANMEILMNDMRWGYLLKDPCQGEKLLLCKRIAFSGKYGTLDNDIFILADISFRFRFQPLSRPRRGIIRQDQGHERARF